MYVPVEGGTLAKSEEFIMFMHNTPKIAIQTTGGDVSSLNRMAKAPHKMIKKKTRALLITAGMSDTFWCFTMQYAVFLIVNTVNTLSPRVYPFSTSLVAGMPFLHSRLSSGTLG